jgi:hypothetical protein
MPKRTDKPDLCVYCNSPYYADMENYCSNCKRPVVLTLDERIKIDKKNEALIRQQGFYYYCSGNPHVHTAEYVYLGYCTKKVWYHICSLCRVPTVAERAPLSNCPHCGVIYRNGDIHEGNCSADLQKRDNRTRKVIN